MDGLLRDTQSPIVLLIRDKNGVLVDAAVDVNVSIVDSGGRVALASQVAVKPAATTGRYEVQVPAAVTARLDIYTATWLATLSSSQQTFRTQFEVAGGFLFSIGDLRAQRTEFADLTKYPIDALLAARESATERIENACRTAFRRRGRRDYLDGSGSSRLLLGADGTLPVRTVNRAYVDGTELTSDQVSDLATYEFGEVRRKTLGAWASGHRNIEILYEYGFDQAPEPVRRAGLILADDHLLARNVVSRATTETTDAGTIRFSIPGRDGPTGIPEVDAVISQFAPTTSARVR